MIRRFAAYVNVAFSFTFTTTFTGLKTFSLTF